jgi:hypothetical protein
MTRATTFAIAAIALFALRQHRRQSHLNRRVHATTMLLCISNACVPVSLGRQNNGETNYENN